MITFFVHKFNDIDHMSPIVYEIAKDLNKKVQILCLNMSYDIYKDYRLNYLSKKKILTRFWKLGHIKESLQNFFQSYLTIAKSILLISQIMIQFFFLPIVEKIQRC